MITPELLDQRQLYEARGLTGENGLFNLLGFAGGMDYHFTPDMVAGLHSAGGHVARTDGRIVVR
jgi:hypothetical protein